MLGNLFAPLAMKVAGGLLALALVFAGIQTWRLSGAKADLEDKRNELATERAQHAVTRQSVDTLSNEMKRLVAEGEVRKARVDAAMKKVAKDTAPLRREAERIEREGLGEDYVERLREAGI